MLKAISDWWRPIRRGLNDKAWMKKTDAPDILFRVYDESRRREAQINTSYRHQLAAFRGGLVGKRFSNDWFTGNIPIWLDAFNQFKFNPNSPINILEIGSWEGLSALFLAERFPKAQMTCVDTWEGADEHKNLDAATVATLSKIEEAFAANLADHRDRINAKKMTSDEYFASVPHQDIFDLIYVDGSHAAEDVKKDAENSLRALKPGGLLIFDDYQFKYYTEPHRNPAKAINDFIRVNQKSVTPFWLGWQLLVRKN